MLRRFLTIRWALRVLGLLTVAFVGIQMIPYGWQHANPPVLAEPNWDSPRTRELAKIACFDCHSNETVWPWYSNVAPLSWLSTNHVNEGRDELNFSEWPSGDDEDIVEALLDGEMPTWDYKLLHPEARLSDADLQALANGLRATIANSD